jgi:hypothetical protein
MPIRYDPLFGDPNIVKFSCQRPDGSCEIVCNQRFAQSIMDLLNAVPIPCGLDPEQPTVGQCAIIMTSSMADAREVKNLLKNWMIHNHVGDLDSIK